jgi:hypothetical protein
MIYCTAYTISESACLEEAHKPADIEQWRVAQRFLTCARDPTGGICPTLTFNSEG